MDEEEFNSLPIEEYEKYIFPNKHQTDPSLTEDDIKCIIIIYYYYFINI